LRDGGSHCSPDERSVYPSPQVDEAAEEELPASSDPDDDPDGDPDDDPDDDPSGDPDDDPDDDPRGDPDDDPRNESRGGAASDGNSPGTSGMHPTPIVVTAATPQAASRLTLAFRVKSKLRPSARRKLNPTILPTDLGTPRKTDWGRRHYPRARVVSPYIVCVTSGRRIC
jgi:hypothetical protein